MMDILMAFLAFSAVMIVLATLATVIVEVVHKLLRQRKKDFERMLENYFEGSLKPLIKGAANKGAKDFVATIRRNPAFAGEHKTEDSSTTRGYVFDTAFEKLTTSQFVEQLARSNVGQDITKQAQQGEDSLIEQLAAEFERYGDAAHDYFKRRAQVFSLFAAVLLALVLNVDAVRLFQSLSSDNDLAKKVVAQIDPGEWKINFEAAQKIGDNDTEELEETINKARANLQKDVDVLSKLDLPIGHAFFPYCSNSGLLQADADQKGNVSSHIDERCNVLAAKLLGKKQSQIGTLLGSWEFFKWFINALLAGLLIGLGAPFWFKTYSFLVEFVPGGGLGKKTETREPLSDRAITQTVGPAANNRPLAGGKQNDEAAVVTNVSVVNSKPLIESRLTTLFRSASGISIDKARAEAARIKADKQTSAEGE